MFLLTPKPDSETKPFRELGVSIVHWRKGRYVTMELQSHFTNVRTAYSFLGILRVVHELLKCVWGVLIVGQAIRRTSPDLVYINEHVVMQGSIAAFLCGVPSVLHIRSHLLSGTFGIRRRMLSRLILGCNRTVFAITESEAEQLSPRGRDREKIKVIGEFFPAMRMGAVDPGHFRGSFGFPGGRPIVTMLGGIEPSKGALEFLRAASCVLPRVPDVVFVIAGSVRREGPERASYYAACMDIAGPLEKSGALRIPGAVTNPLELIAASDIVVSPSTMTHFSRPVIEAWGYAKPVVASRTGHMERLITDGVDGLLVDVGDHEALARSLCRLLGDAELRRALGEAGLRKAAGEFNAERNLQAIAETCDSLMKA